MEFLFLKILLVFFGLSSLPFLKAKVFMEPSSDDFPTIQYLKSSINFNQTFIPFDMSDCYFETIGKNHAFKKYDQFALNISCLISNDYPSCAISRNF